MCQAQFYFHPSLLNMSGRSKGFDVGVARGPDVKGTPTIVGGLTHVPLSYQLKDNNTTTTDHQQRKITIFYSHITPHATSQSRITQAYSRPRHLKQVTINQATAMFHACRTRPAGPQPHHPCNSKTKCHYHMAAKGLPSLQKSLHLGVVHVVKTSFSLSDSFKFF